MCNSNDPRRRPGPRLITVEKQRELAAATRLEELDLLSRERRQLVGLTELLEHPNHADGPASVLTYCSPTRSLPHSVLSTLLSVKSPWMASVALLGINSKGPVPRAPLV